MGPVLGETAGVNVAVSTASGGIGVVTTQTDRCGIHILGKKTARSNIGYYPPLLVQPSLWLWQSSQFLLILWV